MAYTQATAADLKAAFPSFDAVADSTIDFWLERARRDVDASWLEDDRQMGEMLLGAHHLTIAGLGTGAEAASAAEGTGDFQSIRSGSLSLTRFERPAGSAQGEFGSTSYGRQWLALARKNRAGARVTGTGTIPTIPLYGI